MTKTLSDCETDAVVLHGLVQAMDAIDGDSTPQAFQGRGALLVAIERMAGALADDLSRLSDAARKE